jgi:uncharacterized protein (TIGR00290 family)
MKVLVSWSGGKDSALALQALKQDPNYEIAGLLTTITKNYDRISMHGIRRGLLEQQAMALNLPLVKVFIYQGITEAAYEQLMRKALEEQVQQGITGVMFGDIFLEDLKEYREDKLAQLNLQGVFPIWKKDTSRLAAEFISQKFKAVITCVDTEKLDGAFAGREYNEELLADLPDSCDPCGENGEFHSFVYAGPVFRHPIAHKKGEVVLRDNRFSYCDILQKDK